MKRIILFIVFFVAVFTAGVAATSAQGDNYCNWPGPRLVPGTQGRVTPGLPNVIRSEPRRGAGSAILGEIPAGGVFTVLAGYGSQCSEGMNWFYVSYNGVVGWTPEGNNGVYWTEPVGAVSCNALTPLLTVGGQGRVTPGLPNVIRSQPWRGAGSRITGLIPAGGIFNVQSGPSCGDGVQWWLVEYNGITGWTGEGEGTTYWTEPVTYTPPPADTCSNALPPHLTVGASAFVIDRYTAPLYAQPGGVGAPILTIPGFGWFRVMGPPVCQNGLQWWQVSYNAQTGWIAESDSMSYVVNSYTCPGFMPTRLMAGIHARVLPGLPNNLRAQPSLNAQILGQIPGGQSFGIVGGPQCGNNGVWWQVVYNGVTGWTMEGRGSTYWLEPLS